MKETPYVAIIFGFSFAFATLFAGCFSDAGKPVHDEPSVLEPPKFEYDLSNVPMREVEQIVVFSFSENNEPAPSDSELAAFSAITQYDSNELRMSQEQPKLLNYIAEYPDSPLADDAYLRLADIYYYSKKYDSAIGACSTAIVKYPDGDCCGELYYRLFNTIGARSRDDGDLQKRIYHEYLYHVSFGDVYFLTDANYYGIAINFWFDYTLLDTVDLISGGKYCDFLLSGISNNISKSEVDRIRSVLNNKYGCLYYAIYTSQDAYNANLDSSFSETHPGALEKGLLFSKSEFGSSYGKYVTE